MQLDDRLRHLGLPNVDVDDGAALAVTRRRVERRRRRRVVAATVAVVLLIGMAAGAVAVATGRDKESHVATVGPPKRYLPSAVPDDLELATIDEAAAGAAGTRLEDGPGALRIGYVTDPPQPRWLDIEVFPGQTLDVDEAVTTSGSRRVELGDGRRAVLRRERSLTWMVDGAVLRLDGSGVSLDELIAVATSVTVVDERTWRERTAGADVGPPYGFLEPPQTVAEGPGWRVRVGLHRPWLDVRGERLLFEDEVAGGGMMLTTQFDSPHLLSVEHARSGPTVIAYGVGPKGTATFRLTYGDEVVEVDAVVSPSGASVFAVDVGAVETEPTHTAAFDAQGVQLTGFVHPPTPLVLDP